MWFEAIADAKFIRRRFEFECARSGVIERQLPTLIDERSMFKRGDAMNATRMPNVKMRCDSKEHVRGVVSSNLDHILNSLIEAIDRPNGVRIRVNPFNGSAQ
jgi:hypothetical protein